MHFSSTTSIFCFCFFQKLFWNLIYIFIFFNFTGFCFNNFHKFFTDKNNEQNSNELFSTEKRNEMRKTEEINEENSKNNFEIFYFYLLCALFFWISSLFSVDAVFYCLLVGFFSISKFCCWSKCVFCCCEIFTFSVLFVYAMKNWVSDDELIEICFFIRIIWWKHRRFNFTQSIIMIKR